MALLWREVRVAKTDLGLATVDGEVMVVEFVETRGTEAGGIGGTETEIARGIHQSYLGRQMVVEGLVVRQSQTDGGSEVLEEHLLVLGIGSQGIDALVDIARGGLQVILAPVGTEDGGGVACESKDCLQLAVHHPLFLRLDIVADGIVARGDIVLLAIAETIDGEGCLERILSGELIDTSDIPTEAFVAHLVVGTAGDVGTGVGTGGDLV